jgi:hypothetical protein
MLALIGRGTAPEKAPHGDGEAGDLADVERAEAQSSLLYLTEARLHDLGVTSAPVSPR